MSYLNTVPVYAKSRFDFDSKKYVAFLSDFENPGKVMSKLKADSDEKGFGIMSPFSGRIVYFKLVKTEEDSDSPLFWVFEADVDNRSTLAGLQVVIFNR